MSLFNTLVMQLLRYLFHCKLFHRRERPLTIHPHPICTQNLADLDAPEVPYEHKIPILFGGIFLLVKIFFLGDNDGQLCDWRSDVVVISGLSSWRTNY